MPDHADLFDADKSESTLLVLFIPSIERIGVSMDQELWVTNALELLGRCLGGATAFPQGRGVWRDDAQGGKLIYDDPVVIQCYTNEASLEQGLNPAVASDQAARLIRHGQGTLRSP